MKAVKFAVLSAIIMLVSLGCSSANKIGVVGDTTYYNVHAENLTGPNISSLVAVDQQGHSRVVTSVGGPGIVSVVAPAAVSAVGEVEAADKFGSHIRPSQTTVNSSSGAKNGDTTAYGVGGTAVNDQSAHSVDNSYHQNTTQNNSSVNITGVK